MRRREPSMLLRSVAAVFRTEWRRGLGRLAIGAAILTVVDVYVIYTLLRWSDFSQMSHVAAGLYMAAVFSLFILPVLAALLLGIDTVRSEWAGHTQYLWLSLPAPGRIVLGGKILAISAQLALLDLLSWGGVSLWLPEPILSAKTAGDILFFLLLLLFCAIGLLASLATQVAAQAAGGLRGLTTVLPVLCVGYAAVVLAPTLLSRAHPIGALLIVIAELLGIAAVLWLATALWDRKLEV